MRNALPSVTGLDPNAVQSAALPAMFSSVLRNRQLIVQMIRREVVGRYRGSALGLAWSFFTPVLMLAVYTFVFSGIFKARWNPSGQPESIAHFAVMMFVGIIVLTMLTEVLTRSPTLILSNPNFVKKVVFPLEILPIVTLGAAGFHLMVSIAVLLLAFLMFNGFLYWTVILLPLVLVPLVLVTLGASWGLASLGVYLRDVNQAIGLVCSLLMFMSPIFYPLSAVPEKFRWVIAANPLTFVIEQARQVVINGELPDWTGLFLYSLVSAVVAWGGFAWFQKTRKGFADVL
jgi:lipopolysaccharide transport system permease protein